MNRTHVKQRQAPDSQYEEIRFLLPTQYADLIIGTNGANLKRLHQQHCAIINITESHTPERIMTLGGNDLSIICGALDDILRGLYKDLAALGLDVREPDISLLYDESQVEYITSFDEYRLNNILEDSGCLMDVFLTCCPLSTDRVIRLKGQLYPIVECIYQFCEILKWFPSNPERVPYNAINANAEESVDYGGYAHENPQPANVMEIEEVEKSLIEPKQTNDLLDPNEPLILVFTIKNLLANLIRGPSGTRLKQICEESGAKVEIAEYYNTDHRLVRIEGTREQAENARDLVRLIIKNLCTRID